jgi:hypothetical protein
MFGKDGQSAAMTTGKWPDGMTDEDAVHRLQSLILLACEGNKDFSNGREYRAIRSQLLRRTDLSDVLPRYIRSHRDLASFWQFIKSYAPKWEDRRTMVRSSFEPLFDRVEGRTRPAVPSGKWTGRRTTTQQARVVISLGYDALLGVDLLLEEQEAPLHNGGPVEPERAEAITKLKDLHRELGELIRLAEAGEPLEEKLKSVRLAREKVLAWSVSPVGLSLASVPLTGAATILGVGVMYLVNAMASGQGAAFGAAVTGAHVAGAAVRATFEKKGTVKLKA